MTHEKLEELMNNNPNKSFYALTQKVDLAELEQNNCIKKAMEKAEKTASLSNASDIIADMIANEIDTKIKRVIGYVVPSKDDISIDPAADPIKRLYLGVYSVEAMEVIDAAIKYIQNSFDYFKNDNPFMSNVLTKTSPKFFTFDYMTELGEFFLVKDDVIYRNKMQGVVTSTKYLDLNTDFIKLALESYRCKCIASVKFSEMFEDFTVYSEMFKRHITNAEKIIRYYEGNATEDDKKFIGRPLNPFEQGRLRSLIEQRNKANSASDALDKIEVIKKFLNEID